MKSLDVVVVEDDKFNVDLFLGCVGYEKRSSFVFRKRIINSGADILMFDYVSVIDGRGVFSYDENIAFLKSENVQMISDFDDFIRHVHRLIEARPGVKVGIDITSFDREKIARLIILAFKLHSFIGAVKLFYAPRRHEKSEVKRYDVVESFGPVVPEFFGQPSSSDKPLCLIFGAGHEYGKAVGAIDTLEPDAIYCFRPIGAQPEFESEVSDANDGFAFLDERDNLISYQLNDSYLLYVKLRQLINYHVKVGRVLILPLGPKMFAAISIVIAAIFHPEIMVWRHSTVSLKRMTSISDAIEYGDVLTFSFHFARV